MAAISTHLHVKPYQVASTTDLTLPHRKWDHHGTHYAPSHRSAAYDACKDNGDIVSEYVGHGGIIFLFSSGLSVCVRF